MRLNSALVLAALSKVLHHPDGESGRPEMVVYPISSLNCFVKS